MLDSAAVKGHLATMVVLLGAGATWGALNDEGATPLHDAALGGHAAAVDLLLQKGARIDAKDPAHGATPLFLAASWGRKQVVELLLERGASKLIRNKEGKSPREAAAENNHTEVVELLR